MVYIIYLFSDKKKNYFYGGRKFCYYVFERKKEKLYLYCCLYKMHDNKNCLVLNFFSFSY